MLARRCVDPWAGGSRSAYLRMVADASGTLGPALPATPLTAADLTKDTATLHEARIWDWRALEPQLQQIQGLRPYYTFHGVDIDRYTIDGVERQVMITARELNVEKLPDQAKVWVNL